MIEDEEIPDTVEGDLEIDLDTTEIDGLSELQQKKIKTDNQREYILPPGTLRKNRIYYF